MKLLLTSSNIQDYLQAYPPYISFDTPLVKAKIEFIEANCQNLEDKAKLAFEIARDEIHHSFDTQYAPITIGAEDALAQQEGICFAKSHLLTSLLRGMNIASGFCYQRVLKSKDPESGFALHGLNALTLDGLHWFRLDPRGNKPGVNAQFSIEQEQLAYPIRTDLGEVDYPYVFAQPLESVINAMESSNTCQDLFWSRPEFVEINL